MNTPKGTFSSRQVSLVINPTNKHVARLAIDLGFTLIELLITLSIAGILMAVAIPSFTSSITNNRLTTNANEFVSALNFARSEAVSRGSRVSVESIGTTAGQWDSGWNVFVDLNNDGAFNDSNTTPCETNADGTLAEDCILRTYTALPNGYKLRVGSTTAFKDFISYLPSSLSTVTAASDGTDAFILCGNSGTTRRTINIAPTGRPSVADSTGTC